MSLTLIGSPISPFVRKVNIVLLEKSLEFEIDPVSPFDPPADFRDTSPLGRIPALRHDDFVVNDSSVICRYLDRLAPSPPLYPEDPADCARAEWIEEYADGGLIPVAGPGIFRERVLKPMMQGGEPDEAAVQKVIDEQLPAFWDYLEAQLGQREFFVGDALSIADIAVAAPLVNLRLAGVLPEADRWPQLFAFTRRMHARESFAAVISPVVEMIGKRWLEID